MITVDEPSEKTLTLSPKSFNQFCQFITSELGIKMSPAKLPMLQSRLRRRLRELRLPSLEAYQRYLQNGLRENFGLKGTPLRLVMRNTKNPYAPKR